MLKHASRAYVKFRQQRMLVFDVQNGVPAEDDVE